MHIEALYSEIDELPINHRIFAEMDKVKAVSGQYQVRNKTNVSQLNNYWCPLKV